MALVKCKECGKEISPSAKVCPSCGCKPRRTGLFTWVITIFIAIPVLIVIFTAASNTEAPAGQTTETPEQIAEKQKQDKAVQRASVGAVLLKKGMRNPDSFKLESALVINGTGAVCYEYRAQNGFGGMNTGKAVLAGESDLFKTSEMDGFARLWNKECAHKSGIEVETAIRWFAL